MRLFVTLLFGVSLCAQPPQEAGKQKGAPREPKNLKVLKIEPAQIIPTMRAFAAALGVECVHCHVDKNFPSDDNPKKEIARNMILMSREINGKFPDGQRHVSCYTCHRGEVTPKLAAD